MGRPALALSLAATLLAGGCGDPVVILGDWPGYMRVVVGIPGNFGFDFNTVATRTRLFHPHGVATGPDGAMYVGDEFDRIIRVTPDGRAWRVFPPGVGCATNCLRRPEGMAVDSAGRLIVADPDAERLWAMDPVSGDAEPVAGNGAAGSGPDGPALSTAIGTPAGVTADGAGRIYYSERAGNRVRRLESDGSLHTVAGTGTPGYTGDGGAATSATLNGPAGIAIWNGVLYIADAGNHAIRAVDLTGGTIRTLAGTGAPGFGGDGGPAAEAMLNSPQGLAVSTDGLTVYVADNLNDRVRSIDLATGLIQTFAGTGMTDFNGVGRSAGETALNRPLDVAVSPFAQLFIVDSGHFVVWRTALGI